MAILGKIDALALTDTVSVAAAVGPETRSVVTLDAQTPAGNNFNGTGGNAVDAGDLLVIGGVSYYIEAVTSDTTLFIHTDGGVQANVAATRRTAPKEVAEYFAKGGDSATYQLLGIDLVEAQNASNRSRGLVTPGWWLYRTYEDSAGNTRHKAECIASFAISGGTASVVGDAADDAAASDLDPALFYTFTAALADVAGGAEPYTGSDFTVQVNASDLATGFTFQWQRRVPGGRFQNIDNTSDGAIYNGTLLNAPSGTGAHADTLALTITGATVAVGNGYEYRVKINNATVGATELVSNAATLTVTV